MTRDGRASWRGSRRSGCRSSSPSCCSAAHPRRGLELLVDTGLADVVLPELPGDADGDRRAHAAQGRLHALAGGARAGDRPRDRPGPDLVLRLAALLHDIGKPATRRTRAGRPGELPPPRGGRREAGAQAAARAALPEGRRRRGGPAGVPAPALPRLRRRRVDRLGGAPLRHRRRAAAGPAAQAGALGLHHPQPRRAAALQRTYDSLEQRIAALRAQEELDAIRPDLDGNAIMELLGIPPGPAGRARRTSTCSRCGWSAGRWVRRRRRRSCGGGRPRTASRGPTRSRRARLTSGPEVRTYAASGPSVRSGSSFARLRRARRSTRSWATRPSRYTPAVAATSHGATPVGGAQQRGDRHRHHVAEVEHRVVEREHPAAGLVADLALHTGVGAQLHDLAGAAEQEGRAEHGGQCEPRRQRDLRARGDQQRDPHRARPAQPVHQPRGQQRGGAEPGGGQHDGLPHAGHPAAQHARAGERVPEQHQREQGATRRTPAGARRARRTTPRPSGCARWPGLRRPTRGRRRRRCGPARPCGPAPAAALRSRRRARRPGWSPRRRRRSSARTRRRPPPGVRVPRSRSPRRARPPRPRPWRRRRWPPRGVGARRRAGATPRARPARTG